MTSRPPEVLNVSPSQTKPPHWNHEQVQLYLASLQLNCGLHRVATPPIRLSHAHESSTMDSGPDPGAEIETLKDKNPLLSPSCMFISTFSAIEITAHSQVPPTDLLHDSFSNRIMQIYIFMRSKSPSARLNIICQSPTSLMQRSPSSILHITSALLYNIPKQHCRQMVQATPQ